MCRDDNFDRVIGILEASGVPFDKATKKSSIRHLGLDSLDMIELAMAIEEEFGLMISDETIDSWETVGDICITVGGH